MNQHVRIAGSILIAAFMALLAPSAVRAQDPIEKLRQALSIESDIVGATPEAVARRRKQIEATLSELKSIGQLRRAYFLKEWTHHVKADKKDKGLDVEAYRVKIGDRLVQAVRDGAKEPDVEAQKAIAIFVAEMADADQPLDRKGRGKFARTFTADVVALMRSKDTAVRQAALSALGKITPKPKDAVPVLNATLKSDALGPRRLAAYALSELVKNASYLRLPDFDLEKRPDTDNEELQTIDQVIAAASDGLTDDDEAVRGYSLQAIHEATKALTDYLSAPSLLPIVEVKGATVLDRDVNKILKTLQTVNPKMLQRLSDGKLNVRLTAVHGLDQIAFARTKLLQSLQDAYPKVENVDDLFKSADAADPYANIIRGDWKQIASLLRDNEVRLRRGAMDLLEQLGTQVEPASEDVAYALRDSDRWVRWGAARTMRNVSPKRVSSSAIQALGILVTDSDPDVSAAASDTLAALAASGANTQEALDKLVYAIVEGDVENRIKAMKAVVSMRGARAIPKLTESLSDADPRIRRAAAESLGEFGSAARDALPVLRRLLRDDDAEVRLNASEAILSISTKKVQ
jgi:HEAT repeat protein